MAALVKARPSFLPLGCGLVLAALVLTSCGGGGSAPTPTGVTETPPPVPTAVTPTLPPEPTWTSLSNADAIWQQIASSATLIKPILRPSYLPPELTEVRLLPSEDPMFFTIEYDDTAHEKDISITAGAIGNTDLGGPGSEQQQVSVRSTQGTYQLDDVGDPLGYAWLLWEEPGVLGAPANLDHVTYYTGSHGFSRDDLIKVADSLQPVE